MIKNILILARFEISRLRSHFSGKSKFVVLPVVLIVLLISVVVSRQNFTTGKGFYTIGISTNFNGVITDKRFNVLMLDRETGSKMLSDEIIDLYVDGDNIITRNDDRSQYAAGALKKYLEKQEIERIKTSYDINQAFPLRITVNYITTENNPVTAATITQPVSNQEMGTETMPVFVDNTDICPSKTEEQMLEIINRDIPSDPMPTSATDSEVRRQLSEMVSQDKKLQFKADFVSENEVIIPSLMNPPLPLSQIILAFLYVVPVFFVSVFFTSSFTEEKINRKFIILLSSPVSRLQVILGKILPYFIYSLVTITGVTLILKGNMLLAWAIFTPIMLFIFSIYLMVALAYRTFKDQTFFSVLALSLITFYLVVPAMFTGVSKLSFISPLTLAVTMYRGETFTFAEYCLATLPLYLTFSLTIYISRRIFNEEYLMSFKPLHTKIADAIYLAINKQHLNISIFCLGLFLIPLVFTVQLITVILLANLMSQAMLVMIMLGSVILEEIAKSAGIAVLLKNNVCLCQRELVKLATLSALGFWLGEKLLLLITMTFSSETQLLNTILGTNFSHGWLMVIPLIIHIFSTCIVSIIAGHRSKKGYLLGIAAGSAIHAAYNMMMLLIPGVL